MDGYVTELWWMKAVEFNQRELIVELGEEFGPGGPLVMDELYAQAKREKKAGRVRTGWRSIARRCFVSSDDARRIVEHAAEIGALDDYELEDDGRRFRCRVSGFTADQTSAQAAERQARSRAKKAAATATEEANEDTVTVRDGASSERDGALPREEESREEESREEDQGPPQPPASGGSEDDDQVEEGVVPVPPESNRKRELDAYQQQLRDYAAKHFPELPPAYAPHLGNVASILRRGGRTPNVESVTPYLEPYCEIPRGAAA